MGIVGAGPAGVTTSLFLAKAGIPHIIWDKSTFPRDKTCGDGLILHVFKVLRAYDPALLDAFLQDPRFLFSYDTRFFSESGDAIVFNFDDWQGSHGHAPIAFGRRIDFDHFLVQQLVPAYATQHLGSRITAMEPQGAPGQGWKVNYTTARGEAQQATCRVLIGADGIQSQVARRVGASALHKTETAAFVSGYYRNVKSSPQAYTGEIRLVRNKTTLWFYTFPLTDNVTNVSLGGPSHLVSQHKINLREALAELLAEHPHIAPRFMEAEAEGKMRGWGIPLGTRPRTTSGADWLLVGDAAGLANPFYKEGVGSSMFSGMVAARHVAEALAQNAVNAEAFAGYGPEVYAELGHLLRMGERFRRMARYPRLFNGVTRLGGTLVGKQVKKLVRRVTY